MTAHLAAALLAASLAGIGAEKLRTPEPPEQVQTTPAPAQLSEEQLRRQIDSLLGTIDTPVRDDRWKSLGPGAVPILRQIAQDQREFPSRRARALNGLAAIGGPEAEKTVLDLARSPGERFQVRSAALSGAGQLLPPDRLAAELRPVLEGANRVQVRAAAAEVLARHAQEGGCGAMRAQVEREKGDDRAFYHRALRTCDEAERPKASKP
jgi:HEAT repeat protein